MQNLGFNILLELTTYKRLLTGFYLTLEVAVLSVLLTVILGSLFGVIRTSKIWVIRFIFRVYLETVRLLPILVLLYILYYTLPSLLNLNINDRLVGVAAFVFWGAAEMSDIVRSAIISLPKHQTESALSIGLNKRQLYQYILLPQAVKRAVPPTINLAARIIMTTSLLTLIGMQELVKVGKEIIEANVFTNDMAPFWIYLLILIFFFVICYPLSKLAKALSNHNY